MSKHDDDMRYLFEYEISRRDFMLDLLAKVVWRPPRRRCPGLSSADPPDGIEVVRIGYIPITSTRRRCWSPTPTVISRRKA